MTSHDPPNLILMTTWTLIPPTSKRKVVGEAGARGGGGSLAPVSYGEAAQRLAGVLRVGRPQRHRLGRRQTPRLKGALGAGGLEEGAVLGVSAFRVGKLRIGQRSTPRL